MHSNETNSDSLIQDLPMVASPTARSRVNTTAVNTPQTPDNATSTDKSGDQDPNFPTSGSSKVDIPLSPPPAPTASQLNSDAAYQGLSIMDADMDQISSELQAVSSFASKTHHQHGPGGEQVLMLELTDKGENYFKYMRLRELLEYVNEEAKIIDKKNGGKGFPVNVRPDITVNNSDKSGGSSRRSSLAANKLSSSISATLSGEAKEGYCSSANPLRLRDLRRLESHNNPSVNITGSATTVLVRWHCVLLSFEPIRAVVMANRIILMVPDGADTLLSKLEEHMLDWVDHFSDIVHGNGIKKPVVQEPSIQSMKEGKVRLHLETSSPTNESNSDTNSISSGPLSSGRSTSEFVPFETHAYDALLTLTSSLRDQEYKRINSEVQGILKQFQQIGCILSIEEQERMRNLKNQMSHMTNRLNAFQKALDDVVADDEAMALMNLSVLKYKPQLYEYPISQELLGTHEEIEELLENYLNDNNAIEAKLTYLKAQTQSAEELVTLRLDTARNQLLVANTGFAVLACAISCGSFITGAFGMNLDNTILLQNKPGLFNVVILSSVFGIIALFALVIWYLRYTGVLPSQTVAIDNDDDNIHKNDSNFSKHNYHFPIIPIRRIFYI